MKGMIDCLLFLTTYCLNVYSKREDCIECQANLKIRHLPTEVECIPTTKKCELSVWVKSILNYHDVPEEVLTPLYDNLRRIKIFTQGLDATRYEADRPKRGV